MKDMAEIILNDQNFQEEVLKSDKLVLVDFYSNWCPPCKAMEPIIEKIAENYSDKIKVCKLNVDEGRLTASQYGIEAIPTFLFFKAGQVIDKIVGAVPEQVLAERIENFSKSE